jgi:hypothetical protein
MVGIVNSEFRTMLDVSSMPETVVEAKKRIRRLSVNLANVSADSSVTIVLQNITSV